MSGLDFRVVSVPFTQGQETRTQEKLVVPGKWLSLINYSLGQDGTPMRRDGTSQLAAGITGNGLALHGNELLVENGDALSSYSESMGAVVTKKGSIANVLVSRAPIRHSSGSMNSPDCASGGGVTLYAWREVNPDGTVAGINLSLVEEATGNQLLTNRAVSTDANAVCPRVVYDNNGAFYLLYMTTTGGRQLLCRVITAAGVLGTETVILTPDANLQVTNYDACQRTISGTTRAFVAYRYGSGVNSVIALEVGRAATTPSISAGPVNVISNAVVAFANIRAICCAQFVSGDIGVFVSQDTASPGITSNFVTTSFTVLAGAARKFAFAMVAAESHITCTRTTLGVGQDALQIFADQQGRVGTAALTNIFSGSVSSSSVTFGGAALINSACFTHVFGAGAANGPEGPFICGKAFTAADGVSTYLPTRTLEASTGTTLQNAFFLINGTSGRVVSRALYGSTGFGLGIPAAVSPCSSPAVGSSFAVGIAQVTSLLTSTGTPVTQEGLTRLLLTPNTSAPQRTVELGPVTFFPGGQLTSFDGANVVEHGFPLFPENIGLVGAAGGAVTAGVHQVVVVYEWRDNQGQRHQSAPSPAVSITMPDAGANATIVVSVPTLLLSQKANVFIVPYITTVGGTEFFRSASVITPTLNDTTVAFVAINITTSDAVLATNEALYSQPDQGGATLPNDAPPPSKALCVALNRLWLLSADNDLEYRFSQELLNGFGLQFSGLYGDTTLGGLVPAESGGTVSISPVDEKVIILCQRKLYGVFGTGPDASGDNNAFSEPEEIPSPVGCSDARSVLKMPQGLIFKAESGWYLLSRDLTVQYIGEGVSQFDGYTVMSAALMEDRQECRWEVQFPGSQDGVTLVFAYLTGQWSVFYRGSNLLHPVGAVDALWWPTLGRYVFLNPSAGTVPGLFQDLPILDANGSQTGVSASDFQGSVESQVTLIARTSWLRLASLEGYQRVRRVFLTGSPYSPADTDPDIFAMTVEFDDDGSSPLNYSVTGSILPVQSTTTVDVRHKLEHQKCKSVRFTFFETPATPTSSALLGIQALALEVGLKKGVRKLPAAQTI